MHLLIVTPLLPPESGGPSYYAVGLKEALERAGPVRNSSRERTPTNDTDFVSNGAGHTVDTIAFREVRKYLTGIRHLLFLYKVLWRARGADALIILDTVSVALPAVLAGWTLGKRMVIRTGGDFVWEAYVERTKEKVLLSDFYPPAGGKPRPLSRKERMLVWLQKHVVFRLADKIVFNTAWQRDVWREPYRIPDSKTAVIENEYKPKTHEHQGGDAFLSAWRPTAFKNIDTLEQAYAIAKKQYPEMRLEIYKDIPREELHEKMRTARALVIPSLSELGPNMAMEALSMGLPVLLTEDCGARDRLEDFVVWIDPKNPNNIAECMTELMDADAYNAVRSHLEEFTFVHTHDDIAQEFLALLK